MTKKYFQKDDESCYSLQYHIDYMKENNITELEVFEAKAEFGTGYFYCKEFFDVGEVGEGCGKECKSYSPMNGKTGRCRHSGYVYEQTDKIKIITI